jgi:2-oxo-4-hydroxy-4-carboxy--5-ureidoimidazoline (OHCU) decarboxylase
MLKVKLKNVKERRKTGRRFALVFNHSSFIAEATLQTHNQNKK